MKILCNFPAWQRFGGWGHRAQAGAPDVQNAGCHCNLGRVVSSVLLFFTGMEESSWTVGGDDGVVHVKKIAVGGYGEVHQVFSDS
jgi:hypothetical protein